MKYLMPGAERPSRMQNLLKLTRIDSDNIKGAVLDHFCRGYSASDAALMNGTPRQNVERAIKRLHEIAVIIEDIKLEDWHHLTDASQRINHNTTEVAPCGS